MTEREKIMEKAEREQLPKPVKLMHKGKAKRENSVPLNGGLQLDEKVVVIW